MVQSSCKDDKKLDFYHYAVSVSRPIASGKFYRSEPPNLYEHSKDLNVLSVSTSSNSRSIKIHMCKKQILQDVSVSL